MGSVRFANAHLSVPPLRDWIRQPLRWQRPQGAESPLVLNQLIKDGSNERLGCKARATVLRTLHISWSLGLKPFVLKGAFTSFRSLML